jgi:hypothetical protein
MASYDVLEPGATADCRYCGETLPAEGFYPFNAIPGARHVRSRCISCDKEYRAENARAAAAGEREIIRRPRVAPAPEPTFPLAKLVLRAS